MSLGSLDCVAVRLGLFRVTNGKSLRSVRRAQVFCLRCDFHEFLGICGAGGEQCGDGFSALGAHGVSMGFGNFVD